jgi:hypothetical protein
MNNFAVEIDRSNSATKRFECAETIVGKYRCHMDASKVPLMDRAVPWIGIGTQKQGQSSLNMQAYMDDKLTVIQNLVLM